MSNFIKVIGTIVFLVVVAFFIGYDFGRQDERNRQEYHQLDQIGQILYMEKIREETYELYKNEYNSLRQKNRILEEENMIMKFSLDIVQKY